MKKMITKTETQVRAIFLPVIFAVTCCLWGGYHEYVSCGIGAALLAYLLVRVLRQRELRVAKSLSFAAPWVLCAALLLTLLWAQDKGMAPIGVVKFLPLPLFALALLQEPSAREKCLQTVPWIGAGMTVVSALGYFLPLAGGRLIVEQRLAGFFEYPNTFALFLLLGLVIVAAGARKGWLPIVQMFVLLAGIFCSGSRTVFALTVLALLCLAIWNENRFMRCVCRILLPGGLAAGLAAAFLTGKMDSVGRFLTTINLSSSTFLGRLLYAHDALVLLIRYPLGMGYEGYHYIQTSVQTGVYSVQFAHNDLLQCALDAGWIPAVVFVIAIVKTFFAKGTPYRTRLLLAVLCAHGLFDFSFQFVCVPMILLMLLDVGNVQTLTLHKTKQSLCALVGGILACACLYFGAATFASFLGSSSAALAIYPNYTYHLLLQLEQQEGTSAELANKVLKLDTHIAQAYYQKALCCYTQGDFGGVIENQKKAIEQAPYTLVYYEDYAQMLAVGLELYKQAGDQESADICREELKGIPALLQAAEERTSALGWKIFDQPELTLSEESMQLIEQSE